jgi:hypothetical protein
MFLAPKARLSTGYGNKERLFLTADLSMSGGFQPPTY